jgi:hypothetical protein
LILEIKGDRVQKIIVGTQLNWNIAFLSNMRYDLA